MAKCNKLTYSFTPSLAARHNIRAAPGALHQEDEVAENHAALEDQGADDHGAGDRGAGEGRAEPRLH